MTWTAKNGVCCTRKVKRFSSTGIRSQSLPATAEALWEEKSINAVSPKMPPSGTVRGFAGLPDPLTFRHPEKRPAS